MACFSSKTLGVIIVSTQEIAAGAQFISNELSVENLDRIAYAIHFGRGADAGLSAAFNFRIEGAYSLAGNGYWFPLWDRFKSNLPTTHASGVGAADSEAVIAANAGQKVLTVASTAGIVVGDIIYIRNGTVANSEWGRVASLVLNTSFTLEDNLLRAQTGSTIRDNAEYFSGNIDVAPYGRIRAVCDNTLTGQICAAEVIVNEVR